jgi:DNA-binding transcriptional MerR regulator
VYTANKVVEVLANLGVTEDQIRHWERYFGLPVPHDKQGRKFYNESHIKFFKNVKKHLALGYKLADIKKKLAPEKAFTLKPEQKPPLNPSTRPASKPIQPGETLTTKPAENLQLIMLLERVMDEKNQLLIERDYLLEHVHVLEMQKQEVTKTSLEYLEKISEQQEIINNLETAVEQSTAPLQPDVFIGSWSGKAKLLKIAFDSVDIDIPSERNKSFKVTDPPKRVYGNLAVLISSFQSDNDPYWERTETYRVVYISENKLKGELDVEYFVDEVCVAKAIYSITCQRKK